MSQRDCPCYELTDGCGCLCCVDHDKIIGSMETHPSLPECIESDEYGCECHSIEYLMAQSDIQPMHPGQSFTPAEAYEIKQGRREAY
jgi:hypothetical protein